MRNSFEMTFPGINLSDVDLSRLVKFAEMHHTTPGSNGFLLNDSRSEYERCYYSFTVEETGFRFRLIDTEEGRWMVYTPNLFSDDTPSYGTVCTEMAPYLQILGLYTFDRFSGDVRLLED